MKATVIFYPNASKKSQKNGRIPLYMRVCYKGRKSESRLNVELQEQEIKKWDPITMRLGERNSPVNHVLNRLEQKFSDFLILNSTQLPIHHAENIKNYILGNETTNRIAVLRFVDEYFENEVANNINKAPGTVKTYRRAINHLVTYIKYQNLQSLYVDELTYQFASDFKNFLVNSNPQLDRTGMTEVSAAGVIKKFRTIFTQAVEKDLLKKNPFKNIKIKTKSPRRERLTIEQVSRIHRLDLTLFPYQEIYRDIFLFSVYTGLAYNDAIGLSRNNLEKKKDGNYKLVLNRKKTDVITECFLPVNAIAILEKYKLFSESEIPNRVLPYRSNKELNAQLKTIAQLAAIPIRLSTHIARHTFRQLLAEAGVEDHGVIKRMMGQSRNGDVDEIYYSITEDRLLKARNKFQSLLMKNL